MNQLSKHAVENTMYLCAIKHENIKDVEKDLQIQRGYIAKCASSITMNVDIASRLAKHFGIRVDDLLFGNYEQLYAIRRQAVFDALR